MRLSRRDFGLGVSAAALLPTLSRAQGSDLDRQLTAFLDEQYEQEVMRSPEELTRQGRKERYGDLSDRTDAARLKALEWRRASVAQMRKRFDKAKLSEDSKISFEMWELELTRDEDLYKWRRHGYVFDRNGPHTGLPNFIINAHRVDTPADMDAYVSRVGKIGGVLDIELANAKDAAAKGVRMPRFSYEQSAAEVKRLTTGAPFTSGEDSALFADAKEKVEGLKKAGKIDQARADAYVKAVADAMTGSMKPAYDRVGAWLAGDIGNASAEPKGAGSLPDGAAYYGAMLRYSNTTTMTADQIHELGLSQVKRIRGEMETLKAKIGFAGTLEEFFQFMRSNPKNFVTNDDAGRARYLKMAQDFLDGMRAKMPETFNHIPKTPLIVKRVESFREEPGGAAHYASGAPDGSRPGIFYVHLADTAATPISEIEGTAYHEGWPGHHHQIMLAQEMKGLPVFRTQAGYSGYAEGWGLYVEVLAKEMDFYKDPMSDFGRLGREIWRAIRLVLDTGIHAKGWSEKQAMDFFLANSPQPVGKIRSEVRRYFVMPGQATAYMVGQVTILKLRAEARQKLGSKFDIKAFHDVVLGAGSVPLNVLEGRVRRWVAAQSKA